jgi:hypothetical protein
MSDIKMRTLITFDLTQSQIAILYSALISEQTRAIDAHGSGKIDIETYRDRIAEINEIREQLNDES